MRICSPVQTKRRLRKGPALDHAQHRDTVVMRKPRLRGSRLPTQLPSGRWQNTTSTSSPADTLLAVIWPVGRLEPEMVSGERRIREWRCAGGTSGYQGAGQHRCGPRFVYQRPLTMLPGMAPPMASGPWGHHPVLITSDLRDPDVEESSTRTMPKKQSQAGSPGLALIQGCRR